MGEVLSFAFNLAMLDPSDSRGNNTYCIVAIVNKKMGFISYCMSLSLYIMSSFLMHYSVLYELNNVDAGRSRFTCHGRDAYIHDHA